MNAVCENLARACVQAKGQQAFARKGVFAAPMTGTEIRRGDVAANFGEEWKPTGGWNGRCVLHPQVESRL
jgi:hypothetical protein